MNISIWKKPLSLFLSILFLPSFANQVPTQSELDAITQEQINELRNAWEGQLTAIKEQFTRVDMNLQDLALIVGNDKIATALNKRALIEEIMSIRSLINEIQKDPFINVHAVVNVKLIQILNSIVDHVKKSVNQGFTVMEHFDIDATMKRISSNEIDEEKINVEADFEQLTKNIEAFEADSKNIGLVWYNKAYRKFDDAVIQPSIKHNLVPRAGKALFISSLAWYILWFRSERGTRAENLPPFPREENRHMINDANEAARIIAEANSMRVKKEYYWWEYPMRDFFGAYAHTSPSQGGLATHHESDFHYKGKNPTGIIGNTELKIWEYIQSHMAIATIAAPFVGPMLKEEADSAYGWLSKKVVDIHNRLKGGIYSQKAHADSTRQQPKITFDDLVGLDDAKDQLSMILRYIEDPERWERSGLKIERGYLLTGPTRTGKSYIAEALAGEIRKIFIKQNRNPDEFGFYSISGQLIKQAGIDGLLEMAKREAPCVLFIDEIDLLKLQRSTDSDLLANFLTSLSGTLNTTDTKKQVFILAATNRPDHMDAALKASGRLGVEICFSYPTFSERKEFIIRKLQGLAVNLEEFNIDQLVYETAGISYEDLNGLVSVAFQKAKIFGRLLNQELLEDALDTKVRCIRKEGGKTLPLEQRQMIAAHQAGHVLATMLLPTGHSVAKVTILPVQNKLKEEFIWEKTKDEEKEKPIENGKMFTYTKQDTLHLYTEQQKRNICKIHLAGHMAEELLLGECGYSYHVTDCAKGCSDKEKALPFAISLVSKGLRPDDKTSKKVRDKIDADAHQLLEECSAQVRELFEQNKATLQKIAQQLQEKLILTGEEIEAIIGKSSSAQENVSGKTEVVDAAAVEKALGIKEEQPAQ